MEKKKEKWRNENQRNEEEEEKWSAENAVGLPEILLLARGAEQFHLFFLVSVFRSFSLRSFHSFLSLRSFLH